MGDGGERNGCCCEKGTRLISEDSVVFGDGRFPSFFTCCVELIRLKIHDMLQDRFLSPLIPFSGLISSRIPPPPDCVLHPAVLQATVDPNRLPKFNVPESEPVKLLYRKGLIDEEAP